MTWLNAIELIFAGVVVGFINTLAGGGSIISLSLLMFMGLPANVANGTNRIAVTLQTFTATSMFKKAGMFDNKKALYLSIPSVLGSIVGSLIAVEIDNNIFEKIMVFVMIAMLVFIFYKPELWLKGNGKLLEKPLRFWHHLIFFLIGVYGGFIHAGIGYLLLIGLVLGVGFDLIKANAIKVLIVFLFVPFSLIAFIVKGQVEWSYGLVLAIGNIFGAWVASKFAIEKGVSFVRWVILAVVVMTGLHVFGVFDFAELFKAIS